MADTDDLGIFVETTARLLKDLKANPELQRKVQEKNKQRRERHEAEVRAEFPNMEPFAVMFAAIYRDLNQAHLVAQINTRLVVKMIEALGTSLGEKNQHDLFRELRSLTAEEAFKGII